MKAKISIQEIFKSYSALYDNLIEYARKIKIPKITKQNLIETTEIAFLFRGIKYYKAILTLVFSSLTYEAYVLSRSLDELAITYFYLYLDRNNQEKQKLFQIYYLHSLYENYNLLKIQRSIGKRKIRQDILAEEKRLIKLLPSVRTKNLKDFCRNEMNKIPSSVAKSLINDRKIIIFPEIYGYILDIVKPSRVNTGYGKNYKVVSNMLHNNFFNIYGTGLDPEYDNFSKGEILSQASNSILFLFSIWSCNKSIPDQNVFNAYKGLKKVGIHPGFEPK